MISTTKITTGRVVCWQDENGFHVGSELIDEFNAWEFTGFSLVACADGPHIVESNQLREYDGGRPAERAAEKQAADEASSKPTLEQRAVDIERSLKFIQEKFISSDTVCRMVAEIASQFLVGEIRTRIKAIRDELVDLARGLDARLKRVESTIGWAAIERKRKVSDENVRKWLDGLSPEERAVAEPPSDIDKKTTTGSCHGPGLASQEKHPGNENTPEPATDVTDDQCSKVWHDLFGYAAHRSGIRSARCWLSAWRSVLGPQLPGNSVSLPRDPTEEQTSESTDWIEEAAKEVIQFFGLMKVDASVQLTTLIISRHYTNWNQAKVLSPAASSEPTHEQCIKAFNISIADKPKEGFEEISAIAFLWHRAWALVLGESFGYSDRLQQSPTPDTTEVAACEQSFTPGPWRPGKTGGAVVSDHPVCNGPSGSDAIEYYGGHLIAESIAKRNVNLIAAAPEMVAAIVSTIGLFANGPIIYQRFQVHATMLKRLLDKAGINYQEA